MNNSRLGMLAAVLMACGLVGCAAMPHAGCGCGVSCSVEPACGCEAPCDCEPGCAVEPACGVPCEKLGGRGMAFQKFCGGCDCQGPRINVCTGPECGGCGCGEVSCAIEPGCGCVEPDCGCEPACGCEVSCGCGIAHCGGRCPLASGVAYGIGCIGREIGCLFKPLVGCIGGCGGCDSECYWSEWHNDPPRCCDPCNDCGDWVGPTASHRAPYDHEFAPRRVATKEGLLPKLY